MYDEVGYEFFRYQRQAKALARYPDIGHNIVYPALALAGEAGEVANEVKKLIRDDGGVLTPERREKLILEMGDALWYLAALATEIKVSLDEVALRNIEKLNAARKSV